MNTIPPLFSLELLAKEYLMANPILDLHEQLALAAVRFSIEREEEYALFLKERFPELYKLVVMDKAN
jgi:hypothetical protein